MTGPAVAVVGATGAVGREMIATLTRRGFPVGSIRLMASSRSAGSVVSTPWGDVTVEDLATADPAGIDIALFSAGGTRSKDHAPRFAAAGAVVVDNSSAWRMDPGVPLIVAGVNDHAVADHDGIIANPNCTTMVLLMALAPIHRAAGLRSMVVSSYQSVSGTGTQAMNALVSQVEDLGSNVEALKVGGWEEPADEIYVRPIGWNVLPYAGSETELGYTDEEWKLVNETRKILERDDIRVEPMCVRVPVMVGHAIAGTMFFDRPVEIDEALEILGDAPGTQLWGDARVPTPLDSAGIDDVLVGRVRATVGTPGGISLWAVGDNLRKGAALNAVQIAELLLN
ncbi:MAG TPA: aspartate-semialdehyde dehydrogenase [Acidimicrobiia bacterium]|nr:aspartate-semialdehyde dehydrogenase [Acidimicrobiia bacterium]